MDCYRLLKSNGLIEQWGTEALSTSIKTVSYSILYTATPNFIGVPHAQGSESPGFSNFCFNINTSSFQFQYRSLDWKAVGY